MTNYKIDIVLFNSLLGKGKHKMTKKLLAIFLILSTVFLCACSNKSQDISEAKAVVDTFFTDYKNGKVSTSTAGDYFLSKNKCGELFNLLITDDALFSPDTLRDHWGFSSSVISDSEIEEISNSIIDAKIDRFSYKINEVTPSRFRDGRFTVNVTLKVPVIKTTLTDQESDALIFKVAEVSSYEELTDKFFEDMNLTKAEQEEYEQDQFAVDFANYILSNHFGNALIELMNSADIRDVEATIKLAPKGKVLLIEEATIN